MEKMSTFTNYLWEWPYENQSHMQLLSLSRPRSQTLFLGKFSWKQERADLHTTQKSRSVFTLSRRFYRIAHDLGKDLRHQARPLKKSGRVLRGSYGVRLNQSSGKYRSVRRRSLGGQYDPGFFAFGNERRRAKR